MPNTTPVYGASSWSRCVDANGCVIVDDTYRYQRA